MFCGGRRAPRHAARHAATAAVCLSVCLPACLSLSLYVAACRGTRRFPPALHVEITPLALRGNHPPRSDLLTLLMIS